MIIDIETYVDNVKNKSLYDLIQERGHILSQITFYEQNKNNRDLFDIYPTPEDKYKWNNLALIELTNLIISKSS
jgi:hypothetical protein